MSKFPGDKSDLHTDMGGFALCGTVDGNFRAPKNDYYEECRLCKKVTDEDLQLISLVDFEGKSILALRQWVVLNPDHVIESVFKLSEYTLTIIHRKKKLV